MKPLNSHSLMELLALGTVPVLGAFLIWALWPARAAIKANGEGSTVVLAKAGVALDTVNAPCKDNGHQVVCGSLANVNQMTKNVGILAALSAEQIKQSGTLIQTTTHNLDEVGDGVYALTGRFGKTADALTETATTASTTLSATTAHLTPVLDATTETMTNAGTVLADVHTSTIPRINGTLDAVNAVATNPNIPTMMTSFGRISVSFADFIDIAHQVEVRATHDYLHPSTNPWARTWKQIAPFLLPITQIGGAIAIRVAP